MEGAVAAANGGGSPLSPASPDPAAPAGEETPQLEKQAEEEQQAVQLPAARRLPRAQSFREIQQKRAEMAAFKADLRGGEGGPPKGAPQPRRAVSARLSTNAAGALERLGLAREKLRTAIMSSGPDSGPATAPSLGGVAAAFLGGREKPRLSLSDVKARLEAVANAIGGGAPAGLGLGRPLSRLSGGDESSATSTSTAAGGLASRGEHGNGAGNQQAPSELRLPSVREAAAEDGPWIQQTPGPPPAVSSPTAADNVAREAMRAARLEYERLKALELRHFPQFYSSPAAR